jgi:hypothetical protein
MPRSLHGTSKASATGLAKSAKGQATAAAASSKAKKQKVNPRKVAAKTLSSRKIGRYRKGE